MSELELIIKFENDNTKSKLFFQAHGAAQAEHRQGQQHPVRPEGRREAYFCYVKKRELHFL